MFITSALQQPKLARAYSHIRNILIWKPRILTVTGILLLLERNELLDIERHWEIPLEKSFLLSV